MGKNANIFAIFLDIDEDDIEGNVAGGQVAAPEVPGQDDQERDDGPLLLPPIQNNQEPRLAPVGPLRGKW